MNGEAIDRVLRVELKDFRGFKVRSGGEPHVVDTDADLVLLSGANGHGKTSFLEAILLLLTGWYDVDSDPKVMKRRTCAARSCLTINAMSGRLYPPTI